MRLPHLVDPVSALRAPTTSDPLRVIASACLLGQAVGCDGTDYGLGGRLQDFLSLPTLKVISFCPEDHGIGTPRAMPDIYGGDGFDVLDGRARVLDEHGVDLTQQMRFGADAMLLLAIEHDSEIALLTDMSASCGSQVISDGCRLVEKRKFRASVGVTTALLIRNGIFVVSQRDFRTLDLLRAAFDPCHQPDSATRDHHETKWYKETF
jgi:uncharacterized protein YbbK (DUF523 family)